MNNPPKPIIEPMITGYVVEISSEVDTPRCTFRTLSVYGFEKQLYCFHRSLFPVFDRLPGKVAKFLTSISKDGSRWAIEWIKIDGEVIRPESAKRKSERDAAKSAQVQGDCVPDPK
jgi:hypothetical protein